LYCSLSAPNLEFVEFSSAWMAEACAWAVASETPEAGRDATNTVQESTVMRAKSGPRAQRTLWLPRLNCVVVGQKLPAASFTIRLVSHPLRGAARTPVPR